MESEELGVVYRGLLVLVNGESVRLELEQQLDHRQVVALHCNDQGRLHHLVVGMSEKAVVKEGLAHLIEAPSLHIHEELLAAAA